MKKYILSFVLLGFCFVWTCRPKEVPPFVIPIELYANTQLKNVTVEGSTDVSINYELGIIQITLPESYSSKSVVVSFNLGVNTFLDYNWSTDQPRYIPNTVTPQKQSIEFNYQGIPPVEISILYGQLRNNYRIYVNQINKKLITNVAFIDSIGYDFSNYFSLSATIFRGTYPNLPFAPPDPFLLLKSNTTNLIDTAFLSPTYWSGSVSFKLRKFYPFDNQRFSVELVTNVDRQILKENFQIFSKSPIVEGGYNKISTGFELKGGIFLPSKSYNIRLFNDYLKSPILINARVKDANTLIVEPPQSIEPNGYIIEVFENTKRILKNPININKTNNFTAIVAIRKENNNTSGELPSTKKEQLNQGETFSVLSSDALIACYGRIISQEDFDKVEAPSLKIIKDFNELVLSPQKIKVRWSLAGCDVVYFQYTIPKSTESGFYEAQLVYPDGRESLKYWNKIEIK